MHQNNHKEPAELLKNHLNLFTGSDLPGPVLDLACGSGRNGLFLAEHGLDVIFYDRNREKLDLIEKTARARKLKVSTQAVDLESGRTDFLPADFFGAVIVFRYLHRPLIPALKESVRSRGLIVYETFTLKQAKIGKPSNPDFLLQDNELKTWFGDWEIIHYFEGGKSSPPQYVAQIIARKKHF